MANAVTIGFASAEDAFVNIDALIPAGDTVTIGDVVYVLATDPSGTPFEVDVGSDGDDAISNLVAAINLSGTDDDEYGAGTTINPYVTATADLANDAIDLVSKIPGLGGNAIALSVVSTDEIVAGAASLGLVSGAVVGVGELYGTGGFIESLLGLNQINSEVIAELRKLTTAVD